jgi:hypothetical protein
MFKIISLSETIDDLRLKEVECITERLNEYQKYIDGDLDRTRPVCGLCECIPNYKFYILSSMNICNICLIRYCEEGDPARIISSGVMADRKNITEFELAQVIDWQETIFNRTNKNLEKINSQLRIENED